MAPPHKAVQAFIRSSEYLLDYSTWQELTEEDIGLIQFYIGDLIERFGAPPGSEIQKDRGELFRRSG